MFTDALSYPVRHNGWIMIVIGAIFSVVLEIFQKYQFSALIGLAVALFGAGYFGAFYLDIVTTTMEGEKVVPDWPDITSFWDDLMIPLLRLAGLLILSFGPALAVLIFGDPEASWYLPAILAAIVYGCFYFPMSVLAAQALGGLGAALPHIVLPAVVKALPGYIVALGALGLVLIMSKYAQVIAAHIPYIGWLLTSALALYGMMFQGRLIGLIYVAKRAKLGWE